MMTHTRPHAPSHRPAPAYRHHQPSPAWAFIGVGLILLGVASAFWLWGTVDSTAARIGGSMPDFTLTSLAGTPVRLANYKGQVVIVNAWATWCPPCRAEMPALAEFYRAHLAQGFQLLAVNAGEDRQSVASFITPMGFTFPVLLDPGEATLNSFGMRGLPTSYVIGRDGVVKNIHIGEFTPQNLESEVAPLLR